MVTAFCYIAGLLIDFLPQELISDIGVSELQINELADLMHYRSSHLPK